MNKRTILSAALVGLLLSTMYHAPVRGDQKLGYIDSEVLREKLPEFKDVQRKLERLEKMESDSPATESDTRVRVWKDATGKFEISASFEGLDGDDVLLRTADGERMAIARDQLSDSDQNWVKNRTEQDANPFRKRDDD